MFLGEVKKAIEANDLAQKLCRNDHAGLKDLEQQKLKIIGMLEEHMGNLLKFNSITSIVFVCFFKSSN